MVSTDERATRRDRSTAHTASWRWSYSLILVGLWWALLMPTVLPGCDRDRQSAQSKPARSGEGPEEKTVLAVHPYAYDKYEARGLKTIGQSPAVTEHPFVATGKLDAETFDRVRRALLAIKGPDDVKRPLAPVKATMTGLAPVEDEDYDPLGAIRSAVREDEKRAEQRRPAK